MTSRTLVLGGARSGKSAHAEGLASAADPVTYVATARRDPSDLDWQERIAKHVARRPATWSTVETIDLPPVLDSAPGTVLVDDLATWLTGVLDDTGAWEGPLDAARVRCDALVDAVVRRDGPLVLVSAEVGLGVVPATRSGRLFRDELGSLNARLAQACDEVLLLVAGLPLRVK
ncbi:bifunctional adenosylcobinamide kinase/adenosylcobinamide-phosphate guanylyltransferase [Kutzneria sp. NPDC052558]|uniref:bifunctional adenosylcobinamide kinase/adenosylcobinamide-phosphate guanylyltransferase n=1 Tax=Kutzneria sp. NPDC052558 TaxID=3364121 RepID=UPI0037C9BB20